MNKEFLYDLLSTGSVSGNETVLEKKIYDYMQDKADEVTVDELGNVTAAINTSSPFKVLYAGHADEIGLMVTAIGSDGTLMVTNIGGVYATTYPGHKARIYTEKGIIYGAVANARSIAKNTDLKASDLRIDIGAKDKEDALKYVSLGDPITFDTDVRELVNDCITGRALDDRLGAFIVMEALAKAKTLGASVGCYAVSTTGEETTGNGAFFTASRVRPNIAIAVDVTYTSDNCGISEALTGDIAVGKGPVICNNPSIHKKLNSLLLDCAKKLNMDVQIEAANGRTGTDGDTMHRTGIGVPFALVSIPLRYMHNPDEVGSLKDIQDCIDLLAEFFAACTEDMNLKPF
ncbi:MAG: M20/M25/M40 family metallo-hydrolase [Erysipelotrichaceae bacterium]|nr:M20/M25/M40 family metallo-hydrolase [Erysipelotrichaceae bacterium]